MTDLARQIAIAGLAKSATIYTSTPLTPAGASAGVSKAPKAPKAPKKPAPAAGGGRMLVFGGPSAEAQFKNTQAYANLERNFTYQKDPGLAYAMVRGPVPLRGPGKRVNYTRLSSSPITSFYKGR